MGSCRSSASSASADTRVPVTTRRLTGRHRGRTPRVRRFSDPSGKVSGNAREKVGTRHAAGVVGGIVEIESGVERGTMSEADATTDWLRIVRSEYLEMPGL